MVKKKRGRSAAFMRSINPFLKRKRKTKRGFSNVARRKKRSFRRGGRSTSGSMMKTLLGAGIYGAVREPISSAISPITARVPFGTIADEGALLLINVWLAKRGGMLGDLGKAGAIIEAARIGVAISDGSAFASGSSSSAAVGSDLAPTTF